GRLPKPPGPPGPGAGAGVAEGGGRVAPGTWFGVIVAMPRPIHAPLWAIARSKVPRAPAAPTRPPFIAAPALSPNSVMLLGSPPKFATLALSHLNTAIASPSAWLPAAPPPSAV